MPGIDDHVRTIDSFFNVAQPPPGVQTAWREVRGFAVLAAKRYRPAETDAEYLPAEEVLRRITDAIEAEVNKLVLRSDPTSRQLSLSLARITKRLRGVPPSEL